MRLGRTILVWVVAATMTMDSASACRWRSWSSCGPCGPAACYSSCYTSSDSACGAGYVVYPADNCPICGTGTGPVTTNRAAEQEPTPQPTLPSEAPSVPPAEPAAPLEPPMPAPSEPTPAPSAPTTPPAEPMPAAPAPTKPGEVEDLFKEPAPTPAPGEPAAPAAEPAKPAGDVDDLFKEPSATPAPSPAPAEPTKPAGDVDDLFKDPAAPAAPATEPAAPAAEPAKPAGDVDDLFKTDEAPKGAANSLSPEVEALFAEPAAAASASLDKKLEAEADRLFGAAPDGPRDAMRLWTDNTGKFQVRAKLVSVSDTHVRLLKESGKYTTVPLERLSRADLAFVRRVDRSIAASF